MRLLTVPNWSFGRSKILLREFDTILTASSLEIHYLKSDIDHNRTVSAFSGPPQIVIETLFQLCVPAFDTIDLNRHLGVHPRIGALDVCPFLPLLDDDDDKDLCIDETLKIADDFAARLSDTFSLPVFMYEKSARPGRIGSLPSLRKEGFGGLLAHDIDPDFGPNQMHPYLGASVVGVRDFLVAMNINLDSRFPHVAKDMASRARKLRMDGDPRFAGVRALGFALPTLEISQLSLSLTQPNRTPIDTIVEWAQNLSRTLGVRFAGTEIIGVIRPRDLEHGTTIHPDKCQVVEGAL